MTRSISVAYRRDIVLKTGCLVSYKVYKYNNRYYFCGNCS